MTDLTPENTDPDTPKEKKRRKRAIPPGRIVNEIPASRKTSTWDVEFEWFQQNPGSIKEYPGVSQTTPSYLRKRYGLDAKGRNTNMETNRITMYVVWYPEKAEEIKSGAAGRKRRKSPETEAEA